MQFVFILKIKKNFLLKLYRFWRSMHNPSTSKIRNAGRSALGQQRAGLRKFNSSDFVLKDPENNRKYRNTLGKKLLAAAAAMHQAEFSHNDIKPVDIVLAQDPAGNILVKLIDLDLIQNRLEMPDLPTAFTRFHAPPEVLIQRDSEPVPYDAEKGDAYAMELTLREVLRLSRTDIFIVRALQVRQYGEWLARHRRGRPMMGEEEPSLILPRGLIDNKISLNINIVKATDMIFRPTCLKNIFDYLPQSNPDRRSTIREVLKSDFFMMTRIFYLIKFLRLKPGLLEASVDFSRHKKFL